MHSIMNDNKFIKQEQIDEADEKAIFDLIEEYLRDIKSKEHIHDVIYRIANIEIGSRKKTMPIILELLIIYWGCSDVWVN